MLFLPESPQIRRTAASHFVNLLAAGLPGFYTSKSSHAIIDLMTWSKGARQGYSTLPQGYDLMTCLFQFGRGENT